MNILNNRLEEAKEVSSILLVEQQHLQSQHDSDLAHLKSQLRSLQHEAARLHDQNQYERAQISNQHKAELCLIKDRYDQILKDPQREK